MGLSLEEVFVFGVKVRVGFVFFSDDPGIELVKVRFGSGLGVGLSRFGSRVEAWSGLGVEAWSGLGVEVRGRGMVRVRGRGMVRVRGRGWG